MQDKLTQPKIEHYYDWLHRNDNFGMTGNIYDDKSNELLDEFFRLIEQISPISDNGARAFWLRADRGPIEDFGDVEEALACGDYRTREEFVDEWKGYFPYDVEWYHVAAVELKDKGYRAITLSHHFVIVQDKTREPSRFVNEISEFVQWLVDGAKECLEMLRDGTYNDYIRDNLPPWHRTGTICRRDLWNIWPESREEFFENISKEDITEFIELASKQDKDELTLPERLQNITANDFFRYCAMGYEANHYAGCEKSPREQYYLHADGRDEDLGEIAPDDPEAFRTWFHDRNRFGGHPWEVCRGGNSTNVSLYVLDDDKGYYLLLAGDALYRTIETVKFYLALKRAEIPVYLEEAPALIERLTENEKIGIVPEGIIPVYCGSHFPNEHIIDYMNLPIENREQILPFCTWYEEDRIFLLPQGGETI